MFEQTRAMFIYTTSPLHVGAGTSLGAVDNPIQREVHTGHPMVPGSAIKGALRHEAAARKLPDADVADVFGPATGDGDNDKRSGAVAFSDARLVLFPVRSATRGFVYAASPLTLGMLRRTAERAGLTAGWDAEFEDMGERMICGASWGGEDNVDLELYSFERHGAWSEKAQGIANWLAENALPSMGSDFFAGHLRNNLVILPEFAFGFFARNATVVEPHVRIDDATGAADDGGLFYTESLPPESLMVCLLAVSRARRKKKNGDDQGTGEPDGPSAEQILEWLTSNDGLALGERPVQLGGDATTGRGQVVVRIAGERAAGGAQ